MQRTLRLAVACALAAFALGVAVLPLQTASFTRGVSLRVSRAEEAGLTRERMSEVAEIVRAFVVDASGRLPARLEGMEAFDSDAVDHLIDVRVVLATSRIATLVLGLTLVVWCSAAVIRRRLDEVAAVLRLGATVTVIVSVGGFVAGAVSFDALFAAFHSLFFASGTWVFASDSLLIRTFPEPFWIVSGVAWAIVVAMLAGAYAAIGTALQRRVRGDGRESCSNLPRGDA